MAYSKVILNGTALIDLTDDTVTAGSLLSGIVATKNDGTEITGSIATKTSENMIVNGKTVTAPAGYYASNQSKNVADGTVVASVSSNTGGSASMSATGFTASSSATSYYVSLSTTAGSVKAKATGGTSGYVTSSTINETSATSVAVSGNGNKLYIPAAAIAGSSTNATATTTVAPGTVSISKQSTPSGVTNAASGNATTTAPSSGVYVAVKATAAANTTGTTSDISGSGSATVTTAGYAPTTLTGTVSVSGTATAKTSSKDSSMTYVPITTATPAFDGGTLSGGSTATGTNVTLSDTDNGMKIQTAYTAASTAVLYNGAVAGWVSKADNAEALAAQSKDSTNGTAYYVTAVTMPKDKGFTVTTTADTALDTTSDLDVTNNAYRRVDITNKANGTVLVANSGNTTVTSGSATTGNLTVSAYNSSGTAENNKSIVSAGKWVNTDVTASGTYYGRVVVPSTMIIPSGNIQLTQSTSTDVSAYATATVKTATPKIKGGATSGNASASSSTASISDSTNNSGVSFTAAGTASRAKLVYDGAVSGFVTASNGADVSGGGATSATAITSKTYYINGVTLTAPTSGTRTFSVTVPNGASTATFVFNVDTSGNVTITES